MYGPACQGSAIVKPTRGSVEIYLGALLRLQLGTNGVPDYDSRISLYRSGVSREGYAVPARG